MDAATHTVTMPDGTPLHVEVWRPAGAVRFVVVIAHGGDEHVGRYAALAAEFGEQGGLVFGLDHRGQGLSGGPRGHVTAFEVYADDLRRVMLDMAARLGEAERPQQLPWFLFGHSMGGLIALMYLIDHQREIPLRGAIFSSPLLGVAMKVNPVKLAVAKVAAKLLPRLALPPAIPNEFLSRDPEVGRRQDADKRKAGVVTAGWFGALNAAFARVTREAASIELPCLWYFGSGDRIVDVGATQRLFDALPQAAARDQTLRVFDGYYHELHNEPPEFRAKVIAMLREWIAAHL